MRCFKDVPLNQGKTEHLRSEIKTIYEVRYDGVYTILKIKVNFIIF